MLLFRSAALGYPGAGQQADLVIDEQHDRVVDGWLVVAEPAGGACLGEGNLVRRRGSSNRGLRLWSCLS
jgi:lipopolysaccharide biosynthesis regulator YciM